MAAAEDTMTTNKPATAVVFEHSAVRFVAQQPTRAGKCLEQCNE